MCSFRFGGVRVVFWLWGTFCAAARDRGGGAWLWACVLAMIADTRSKRSQSSPLVTAPRCESRPCQKNHENTLPPIILILSSVLSLIPPSRSSHIVHCNCLISSLLHISFSWRERLSNHRSLWLNTERAPSHTNYHRCRQRWIPTLAACNRRDEKKNNRLPRPAGPSAGVGNLLQFL